MTAAVLQARDVDDRSMVKHVTAVVRFVCEARVRRTLFLVIFVLPDIVSGCDAG